MGNANSNLTQSSEAGTLNWNDVKTEGPNNNGFSIKKLDNGMEEINLEINPLSDSENSIADIFQKIEQASNGCVNGKNCGEQHDEDKNGGSSPFISSELYKKIMDGGENDSSSPFISTAVYKKIMKGGAKDLDDSSSSDSNSSSSSTSSSELLRALSEISISSSDYPKKSNQPKSSYKKHNNESKYHLSKNKKQNESSYGNSDTSSVELKGYGFSETSSDIINNSNNKYYTGGNTSETPYNMDSSSIATSDINLISVDSVNGRRFINKN